MEYAAALAWLEGNGHNEVRDAVKERIDQVLREKRVVVAERDSIRADLESAGAEGEGFAAQVKDLTAKLKQFEKDASASQSKVAELEASRTKIEADYAKLVQEKSTLERSQHLSKLAAKAGASPEVLEMLTKDLEIDKLAIVKEAIDGKEVEVVKIDGKAIKDWVESNESLKPFLPALFVQTPAESPRLPSAPPGNGQPPSSTEKQDVSWITKRFAVGS